MSIVDNTAELRDEVRRLRAEVERLKAYRALADEAYTELMDRLDAYPEDWSELFADQIRSWLARYDALKELQNL